MNKVNAMDVFENINSDEYSDILKAITHLYRVL